MLSRILNPSKAFVSRTGKKLKIYSLLDFVSVALFQSRVALVRNYSDINPANKKDYDAFVHQWHTHFKNVDDDFELERGLNHIFAADWVPAVEVLEEAIKASRRLNSFATAVRILESLEEKVYKKEQYQVYLRELQPLLDEYGIVDKKALGEFLPYRERNPREE
jgi:cytochrome c oxidase subunit 5a